MVSEIDIFRTAKLWLDRHETTAIAEARKMAAKFQAAGDYDGGDAWLRIILALETLTASPTRQ
jgi:hypothetical protein